MTPTHKHTKKSKPRLPRVNFMAGTPRPKPISFKPSTQILDKARELPLLGCWVMSGWQDQGLTPVVVARKQSETSVLFGVFLVDLFCLGVKDAFWKSDLSLKQFNRQLPQLCAEDPALCDVDLAHEMIYGSIEYAQKYGFEPHHDYAQASLVLDPPEMHLHKNRVTFGKDGKPFFISGPNDNAKMIFDKLMHTAGEGNFEFLMGFDGMDEAL